MQKYGLQLTLALPKKQLCTKNLSAQSQAAPDLDGGGPWGPGVVGGPMCGYKMFRSGMIDDVTRIPTYH